MTKLKVLAKQLVEECLNASNTELIGKFYSTDVVFHGGSDGKHSGHPEIESIISFYDRNFPNLKFSIEDMFQDGNTVIVRWVADTNTQDPDSVDLPGITILQYEDELISEIWQEFDKGLLTMSVD